MTGKTRAHETTTIMVKAAPAEVYEGSDIVLKVRVACPSECDLRGNLVKILDQDGVVAKEIELVSFRSYISLPGEENETAEFVLKPPTKPGEYTWRAVFPAQEKGGVLHEESSTPFSFVYKLQGTSIAVWDIPSPIVSNAKFKLKVGVRCAVDCRPMDRKIEIYDQEGAQVATETLGGIPWPGTIALYWAEVELEAPGTVGEYTWTVKVPEPNRKIPQEEASCTFGFRTVKPPEHWVTVEVIDKETQTPIQRADVILHPYRGLTDEHGMARLMVPKGDYELYITEVNKEIFQTTLKVTGDIAVKAELLVAILPDMSG